MSELSTKEVYKKHAKLMVERLEKRGIKLGLETAEQAVRVMVEELGTFATDAATESKIPHDDILIAVGPVMKQAIEPFIDRISE